LSSNGILLIYFSAKKLYLFIVLYKCHASHPFNLSELNILTMLGGNTNFYICHFKIAGDKLDEKCIYNFWLDNPERKRHRWDDKINVNVKEVGY
jgi:hypothetical protein